MSLLVDPDYIIHSLRLAYLGRIDDHAGPRVITLPSVAPDANTTSSSSSSSSPPQPQPGPFYHPYAADSHVSLAGLTNPAQHPEITSIHSPVPQGGTGADPLADKARSSKPASGLRYTQTIYGPGRSGVLGMRVSGKRAQDTNRPSLAGRLEPQTRPTDDAMFSPPQPPPQELHNVPEDGRESQLSHSLSEDISSAQNNQAPTLFAIPPDDRSSTPNAPVSSAATPIPAPYAESSTDTNTIASSIGSPDFLNVGSLELPAIPKPGDNDFDRVPTILADDAERGGPTARSSPIKSRKPTANAKDATFRLPASAFLVADDDEDLTDNSRPRRRKRNSSRSKSGQQLSKNLADAESFSATKASANDVASRHATRPKVSALSALMRKQDSGPSNPFAAFYSGIAGRASTAPSMNVELYFPWAASNQSPPATPPASGAVSVDARTRSMKLRVRKDATMEEVIGYGLFCYAEEGWKPDLDPGSLSEQEQESRLTTIGWTLRIVEDGEVDEDFPAIDRTLTLGKFGGDEFAVCEATSTQIKQHKESYDEIVRRASRVVTSTAKKSGPSTLNPRVNALADNKLGVTPATMVSTPIFATGALSRTAAAPSSASIFLRVLVTPNPEVRYKTTLQVPADMYLADVLEMICRKRHLANVDEWALLLPDKGTVVPLDRTVESLEGNHDLALVRRTSLGATTQPRAPRLPLDVTSAYKSFTVSRKTPMFVARHERTLTLDGDWVHIMPTDMRTLQKAASFHISAVVACKQSSKIPTSFKLVVWRESPRDTKRYDFDADSQRQAAEIVREINTLRAQQS